MATFLAGVHLVMINLMPSDKRLRLVRARAPCMNRDVQITTKGRLLTPSINLLIDCRPAVVFDLV